jgi:flagellar hook protein FlgE
MNEAMGIQDSIDDPQHPIPGSVNNIPGELSTLSPGATLNGGKIRFVSNNGVDNALSIGLSGFQLTALDGDVTNPNLSFGRIQEAQGQSAVADFLVYDSLGFPIDVRLTAVLESRDGSSTTYRWFADSAGNDPTTGVEISVGTGLVSFDGEGNLISATNSTISIDRRNVPSASPLEFDLDFSNISGLAADKSTLAAARQDGSSAGKLTSFIVGEDGVIRGVFSNGVTRDLGQVLLARFANPAGLEQKGQNMFAQGVNSGLPIQGRPGDDGIGTLVSGAVELSNTDIGRNLIDLVLATTQYRGNSRVIATAQQLLDELLNLRR